jgi:Ca2+-binding EF-hand superfamily protein
LTLLPLLALTMAGAGEKQQPASNHGARTEDDGQDIVFMADARPLLIRLHIRVDGKPLQAAWQEFVEHLFKTLDIDGDGVLSEKEAERVPTPQTLFGTLMVGRFQPDAAFPRLYSNGTGKIKELADYYRKTDGGPFQVRHASDQGNVGARKVVAPIASVTPIAAELLDDALFELLDQNKDGKLSRDELAMAEKLLLAHDADDDEMITPEELVPPGSNLYVQGQAQQQLMARGPAVSRPVSRLIVVGPRSTAANLARQLLARYAAKGSDRLGRSDIHLEPELFKRLDQNGDGKLDVEELSYFTERPPDVELNMALEKRMVGEPQFVSIQANQFTIADGVKATMELVSRNAEALPMTRPRNDQFIFELGPTHIRLQADSRFWQFGYDAKTLRQAYKTYFQMADVDKNGYLDAREMAQHPIFRTAGRLMDRNGDGKLYEAEMLAYLDEMQDLATKASGSCATLTYADLDYGLFGQIDTNGDGRLSVRELRNAVKLVEKLDTNGDQLLSRLEIPRVHQLIVSRGSLGQSAIPARSNGATRGSSAGPLWFRKMDRNHDGDVSRREFLGSDEDFKRIDTDGDGLISVEEAERYDASRRAKPENARKK